MTISDCKVLTLADQAELEPGWYWIMRCEPEGPPYWEVARFRRYYEGGESWDVAGSAFPKLPTRDPRSSNAWHIGPRVEPPA